MYFPLFVAGRYFLSKKSHSIVNIISWVSIVGVVVCTASLVIILSAFNGIEGLVKDMYSSFDSDISIYPKAVKSFEFTDKLKHKILSVQEIQYALPSVEEKVLIKKGNSQRLVILKGVEKSFFDMTGLCDYIQEGNIDLRESFNHLVVGYGISENLDIPFVTNSIVLPIVSLIYPNKNKLNAFIPTEKIKSYSFQIESVFYLTPEFDDNYVLLPIDLAQEFLDKGSKISMIEIGLNSSDEIEMVKQKLETLLGKEFELKTRFQKNELLFRTNKIEKLITFIVLIFILLLSSLNIAGTITMLGTEKKEDIKFFLFMGAEKKEIRKIFFSQGMFISFIGSLIGLLIGYLVCFIQIKYKLIKFSGVISYYPVKVIWSDLVMVLSGVILIALFSSWLPVRQITKNLR